MQIEKTGRDTIRVTVSDAELNDFGIDGGPVRQDNVYVHLFFAHIFSEAEKKFDLNLRDNAVYIESFYFGESSVGNVIYVSLTNEFDILETENEEDDKITLVFFSKELTELSNLSKEIILSGEQDIKSSFWVGDEGYFLIVRSAEYISCSRACVGIKPYCAEYIEEHFEPVEEENAIDKLAVLTA
ncbi:MAG: adaptor protein MecA [Ruminococcus sp.]|jgi:negative regulator of genetic competence, sporulation and motility|nr:adaptor protein MecA [Ruminococcus sp.]